MDFSSVKTGEIPYEKILTWLRKRNFKRETESLLIAEQNKHHKTQLYKSENR